jgi:hypothetical protein
MFERVRQRAQLVMLSSSFRTIEQAKAVKDGKQTWMIVQRLVDDAIEGKRFLYQTTLTCSESDRRCKEKGI